MPALDRNPLLCCSAVFDGKVAIYGQVVFRVGARGQALYPGATLAHYIVALAAHTFSPACRLHKLAEGVRLLFGGKARILYANMFSKIEPSFPSLAVVETPVCECVGA